MANLFPPGGLPIGSALHVLVTGPLTETLAIYMLREPFGQTADLRSIVQVLWSCVQLAEMEGRIQITGILPGEKRSETLERNLLLNSTADFERNTLSTVIGTVKGVLIQDAQLNKVEPVQLNASPSTPAASSRTKRGRPGKHDWPRLMADLAVRLSEHGVPAEGEKAELERWAASMMLTDPAESEIRIYVTQAIEAHRKSIG